MSNFTIITYIWPINNGLIIHKKTINSLMTKIVIWNSITENTIYVTNKSKEAVRRLIFEKINIEITIEVEYISNKSKVNNNKTTSIIQ